MKQGCCGKEVEVELNKDAKQALPFKYKETLTRFN